MQQFGRTLEQALAGQLDKWAQNKDGRLALILLLDQMTRNIFRNTPKAFSGDEIACALSLRSVADGFLKTEKNLHKRQFFLMPMMHSEDLEIQKNHCLCLKPSLRKTHMIMLSEIMTSLNVLVDFLIETIS